MLAFLLLATMPVLPAAVSLDTLPPLPEAVAFEPTLAKAVPPGECAKACPCGCKEGEPCDCKEIPIMVMGEHVLNVRAHEAKPKPTFSVVNLKPTIDRLESERDLLVELKDNKQKGRSDKNVIVTQAGVWRYEMKLELQCQQGGRQCKLVPVTKWRFTKANPVPERARQEASRKRAGVPIRNVQHLRYANTSSDYAAPLPDGVVLEPNDVAPTPRDSTGSRPTYSSEPHYGPYNATYANGNGGGCSAGSGCGGSAGAGCGGVRGILGGLFGRRRR